MKRIVARALRVLAGAVRRGLFRWRRAIFVTGARLRARAQGARLTMDVSRDVRLGRGIKLVLPAGRSSTLRIGAGTRIEDDVEIRLDGGTLTVGRDALIRRGCVLHVAGRLELADTTAMSYGCVIHCDGLIRLETHVGMSEYVTLADSRHVHEPGTWFRDNLEVGEIVLGRGAWLAPKVTVTMDCHIGDNAIVAANAAVVGDIPAGALAGGVPAEVIRPPRPIAATDVRKDTA